MTGHETPAQRLNAAHRQIDKLTDEVATLSRVLAAQNQATASIQRAPEKKASLDLLAWLMCRHRAGRAWRCVYDDAACHNGRR